MNPLSRCLYSYGLIAFCAASTLAASPVPSSQQTPSQPAAQQPSTPDPKDPQKPEDPPRFKDLVIVTSSKLEQKVIDAPSTMSVITSAQIELAPSQNFAELMRSIPGVNITQVSARDINITSRGATGTLATGQLALLDGRSLYQDFFGFVMWDFMPVNLNEVKQIEVIRGPAAAVWGANAVSGVVNVITKSPREMQGTSAVVGFGTFDRSVGASDEDAGGVWYASGTHAAALNDRWSFKLSAGAYSQDAFARPTGLIPGGPGTPYPLYQNEGTLQPKFDARVDYDYPDGQKLSFSGGLAGTEGIMHSGIGPFDIKSGSRMGYARVNFTRQGFRAAGFMNVLDGDAANLLTRTPTNNAITFAFATKTFDLEASNVQTFKKRHAVSYGGNLRFNRFDLSLAPEGDDRTEFGAYAQDEIFFHDRIRLNVGGRVDRFDYLDDFVFSPRVALLLKPEVNHTVRLSYNRAYRSPSVVNNFLQVTIAEPINLGLFHPAFAGQIYPLPVHSVGNQDLKEQSMDAYELSYTGSIGRTVLSAALFTNRTKNEILFTEVTGARYTSATPPPGWPAPLVPAIDLARSLGRVFPGLYTYQNFGKTTQNGLELGFDTAFNQYLNVFGNYSYQAEPEPEGFLLSELNIPAENRFNAGVGVNYNRLFGNVSLSYSDSARWQDVLDARYAGTTEAYTLVNGTIGYRWNNRFTTAIKAINLGNDEVQQHVFGDIMKRQIMAELRVNFVRRTGVR